MLSAEHTTETYIHIYIHTQPATDTTPVHLVIVGLAHVQARPNYIFMDPL